MISNTTRIARLAAILAIGLIVASCSASIPQAQPTAAKINPSTNEIKTPARLPVATQISVQSPSAIPEPGLSIWVAPDLPEDFQALIKLPATISRAETQEQAGLRLEIRPEFPVSNWIYALVAPFPTVPDSISIIDLKQAWLNGPVNSLPFQKLIVDQNTAGIFSKLWGEPSQDFVSIFPSSALLDSTWNTTGTWAIVPFSEIEPRWKVIEINGDSPIHKDFQSDIYPLSVKISLTAATPELSSVIPSLDVSGIAPATNRDPSRLTTVIMTGTTALVRATAKMMELYGMTYPGQDIRSWMREADFTHVSNEIPFTPKCPPSYPRVNDLTFCSKPEYIQLLEDLHVNIVELTGDHFKDWGPEAMLYTLDMYKQREWNYYGGGANLEDGRKPLLLEHNGNKLAFIGCNAKPPGYSTATQTQPGAVHCDMPYLLSAIKDVKAQGYLPIVTYQHLEYYSYDINPALQPDFRAAAAAGAVIVSGSQAHQPQGMEFSNGSFLHYGLGNLFFDQYNEGFATRQAFIDRHVFYNGRYINTELLTIMFVDLARPRPMTTAERRQLLDTIFQASGWK
jgi:hypothetical protein